MYVHTRRENDLCLIERLAPVGCYLPGGNTLDLIGALTYEQISGRPENHRWSAPRIHPYVLMIIVLSVRLRQSETRGFPNPARMAPEHLLLSNEAVAGSSSLNFQV
jgi:hypothetical protein